MFVIFAHTMLLDSKQFSVKKSLVCGLPTEKQVKPPVLSDWSSPVLPYWSAPAMGAPPKANQPGKPFIGNGEHLANWVSSSCTSTISSCFPWYFSTAGPGHGTPIRQGVTVDKQKLFVFKL